MKERRLRRLGHVHRMEIIQNTQAGHVLDPEK